MVFAEIEKQTLEQTLAQSEQFLAVFQWVLEYIREKEIQAVEKFADYEGLFKNSDQILELIERKRTHTWDVIQAMWDILESEGFTQDIIPYLVVALTHDIERFSQIFLGSFNDSKTGFDHAERGADLFELYSPDVFTPEIRALIVTGIREHSKKIPEIINDFVDRTRDADKLALMREFEHDITRDLAAPETGKTYTITSGAIEEFIAGQTVSHKNIVEGNWADRLIRFLSWIYDFNLSGTKRRVIGEGLLNRLLEILEQIIDPVQHQQFLEIKAQVNTWVLTCLPGEKAV